MEKYANLGKLWDGLSAQMLDGYRQDLIALYNSCVFQAYREAAMFIVPLFRLMMLNIAKKVKPEFVQTFKEVLEECEAVAANGSIYLYNGNNELLSDELKILVEKADIAIGHAGNLCNNFPPDLLPEEIHNLIMLGRDICDNVTRRIRI